MSDAHALPATQSDDHDYATIPITYDEPAAPEKGSDSVNKSARKGATPPTARKRLGGLIGRVVWGVVTLLVGALLGVLLTVTWLVWLAPAPQTPLPDPVGKGSLSITVDDAFLTNVAQNAANTAGLPIPITNVHAHIEANDTIAITGDVPGVLFFGPTQFSALAQPRVVNGHLTVHLLSGTIGAATAPTSMLSALESAINQQLNSSAFAPTFNGVQYVVTGVATTNGAMTVKLSPKE